MKLIHWFWNRWERSKTTSTVTKFDREKFTWAFGSGEWWSQLKKGVFILFTNHCAWNLNIYNKVLLYIKNLYCSNHDSRRNTKINKNIYYKQFFLYIRFKNYFVLIEVVVYLVCKHLIHLDPMKNSDKKIWLTGISKKYIYSFLTRLTFLLLQCKNLIVKILNVLKSDCWNNVGELLLKSCKITGPIMWPLDGISMNIQMYM